VQLPQDNLFFALFNSCDKKKRALKERLLFIAFFNKEGALQEREMKHILFWFCWMTSEFENSGLKHFFYLKTCSLFIDTWAYGKGWPWTA
jgi:hypothetical protein